MDRPRWYRRSVITRWFTLGYYCFLRKLCRGRPELRRLRKQCGRCKVKFLTGPWNRKQTYMGCVFGCREERKREKCNARGRRHSQTAQGRKDKKIRNQGRSLVSRQSQKQKRPTQPPLFLLSASLLRYVATLIWLGSGQRPQIHELREVFEDILANVFGQAWILRQRSLPERGG